MLQTAWVKKFILYFSPIHLKAIKYEDSEMQLEELLLTDVAVLPASKNARRFGAIVKWKGKGQGTLKISGPQGKIFAMGRLVTFDGKLTLALDHFSDEMLSQQFDRSVLFGEADPMRLHVRTKIWLEQVLLPVLEDYVKETGSVISRP